MGGLASNRAWSRAGHFAALESIAVGQDIKESSVKLKAVSGLAIPNRDFFTRSHFGVPQVDVEKWALAVGGLVSQPFTLSYTDLLSLPSRAQLVTMECAGNPVGAGGVGTARWGGVPVRSLLERAGVRAGANAVVLYGADSGSAEGAPPGTRFARAIPLEKALEDSTLLAYEMNNEALPAEHGFPLRAVVSGWYGMDFVKWLTRIDVLDQPFAGFFMRERYTSLPKTGEPSPITRMRIKSQIFRPSEGEAITSKTYDVKGAAWAGEKKVARVEVRINGEGEWHAANLASAPAAYVWTLWTYQWTISAPGSYTLEVRATDEGGQSQPAVRDPARQDPYELNTCHSVHVDAPA